jgi:antitoxin MazE
MNANFSKWGNSLAVRIPSGIASELRVAEGDVADLQVRDGVLVITPVESVPVYDIEQLVAAITPENMHGETDTGAAVGNEFA